MSQMSKARATVSGQKKKKKKNLRSKSNLNKGFVRLLLLIMAFLCEKPSSNVTIGSESGQNTQVNKAEHKRFPSSFGKLVST